MIPLLCKYWFKLNEKCLNQHCRVFQPIALFKVTDGSKKNEKTWYNIEQRVKGKQTPTDKGKKTQFVSFFYYPVSYH